MGHIYRSRWTGMDTFWLAKPHSLHFRPSLFGIVQFCGFWRRRRITHPAFAVLVFSDPVTSSSLPPHEVEPPPPPRLLCPWDFAGKNSGVGCPSLSPGDLPNSGMEPTSAVLSNGFLSPGPPARPISTTAEYKYLLTQETCEKLTV